MHIKTTRHASILLILSILLLMFLATCNTRNCQRGEQGLKLEDIAYGNPCHYTNAVYITENEQYTPYLVFPSDYNGNLLLIRSEITEESIIYEDTNIFNTEGNYYPNSNVDRYLNEIFVTRFTSALQSIIPTSNIEVATLATINRDVYARKTEFIPRKIFLLSATELGVKNGMAAKEGSEIKGLNQFSPVEAKSYWLRTAYLWDDVHAWSYSAEYTGQEPVSSPLPLRPAFALSPELTILERNDIIQDTQTFVLAIDE